MGIFDSIIDFVKRELGEKTALSPINKDTLLELVQENIKSLTATQKAIRDSSNKHSLLLAYNAKKIGVSKDIPEGVLNLPNIIGKSLTGKARLMEDQRFLESSLFVCNVLIEVNKSMLKNLDKMFTDKFVVINKIKVTDVYCLSIIRQSDFYSNYCNNLIGLISSVINNIHQNFPKYRQTFLLDKYTIFISITDRICSYPNNVFSLRDLQNVKDSGMDFKIQDGEVLSGVLPTSMTREIISGVNGLVLFPNPFRFFSELMVDYKHSVFLKNKETKEWLEYHVALLKMEEQNTNKDNQKYVTLTKTIAFYEDKIAKKQSEIDKYLKE